MVTRSLVAPRTKSAYRPTAWRDCGERRSLRSKVVVLLPVALAMCVRIQLLLPVAGLGARATCRLTVGCNTLD